jgi:hypothetical protein
MSTSSTTAPTGPAAPLSNPSSGIRALRVAGLVTLVGGLLGALILLLHTEGELGERPFVGLAIAIAALTVGLVTVMLFLAGWAETTLRADRFEP